MKDDEKDPQDQRRPGSQNQNQDNHDQNGEETSYPRTMEDEDEGDFTSGDQQETSQWRREGTTRTPYTEMGTERNQGDNQNRGSKQEETPDDNYDR